MLQSVSNKNTSDDLKSARFLLNSWHFSRSEYVSSSCSCAHIELTASLNDSNDDDDDDDDDN